MNILYLIHTGMSSDLRILKEMHTIAKSDSTYNVFGIAVIQDEDVLYASNIENISQYSIFLRTRNWILLPLDVIAKIFIGEKLIYNANELELYRNDLTTTLAKMILFVAQSAWRFIDVLIVASSSIDKWYKDNISEKNGCLLSSECSVNEVVNPLQKIDFFKDQKIREKSYELFLEKYNVEKNYIEFVQNIEKTETNERKRA